MSTERWRRVLATSTSLAVALAMGGGLFALVADTAESQGNSAVSGETITAEPMDLQIAEAIGGSCDSVVWGDGPIGAVITASIDMNADTWTEDAAVDVCLRNNSDRDGFLQWSFADILETEVGACNTDESTWDSTCTDGESGELGPLLQASLTGTCPAAAPTGFYALGAYAQQFGELASQATCLSTLQVQRIQSSEAERVAAQTDRVEWDLVFGLTNPGGQSEVEPNNQQVRANVMGSQSAASISPAGDVDWFQFDNLTGQLSIETSGPEGTCTGDTVLELYDGSGTLLASDDDGGDGVCSRIDGTFAPETVFAKVRAYSAGLTIPSYVLYQHWLVDEVEPNDTFDQANTLNEVVAERGELASGTDVDWYVFTTPDSGAVFELRTMGATPGICTTDTVLEIYNYDGTVLHASDDNGSGECSRIVFDDPAGGENTFRVKVSGALGDTGGYVLKLKPVVPAP